MIKDNRIKNGGARAGAGRPAKSDTADINKCLNSVNYLIIID